MPLLSHTPAIIELPVSDRVAGDTIIRQKARFVSLTHTQDSEGTCTALITVLVTLYSAEGDGFGLPLPGQGITTYPKDLTADNNTLVDAHTGVILAIRQGEQPSAWQAIIDAFPQPTMLQGDFFEYLRENQPVLIGDMIRQHIQQADAMGRFS